MSANSKERHFSEEVLMEKRRSSFIGSTSDAYLIIITSVPFTHLLWPRS